MCNKERLFPYDLLTSWFWLNPGRFVDNCCTWIRSSFNRNQSRIILTHAILCCI